MNQTSFEGLCIFLEKVMDEFTALMDKKGLTKVNEG